MDWIRADGSLDVAAFMRHACSIVGDPAERVGLDVDAVRVSIIPRPAWHSQANCLAAGSRLFFAGTARSTADARARYCDACPVTAQCLADGLSGDEVGVWGASTPISGVGCDVQPAAPRERGR